MKELLPVASVVSASAGIALAAVTMFSSIVSATPSIEGGHSISNFCSTFGKATAGIYMLKEQGYEKQYVVKALINEGIDKNTVNAAANTAYELKSGMNRNHVQQRVIKSCISAMSKMEAAK